MITDPSEVQAGDLDTLPQWLYWRFAQDACPWGELSEGDQLKWVYEAEAVRRAVARGGFKKP